MKTWIRSFILAAFISAVGGLAVASLPPSSDKIANAVQARLAADLIIKGSSIKVTVADGFVTLTGCVASQKFSNRAARIANKSLGVRAVKNKLKTGAC
jgi:osmotically-inducible protein OsmY